MPRSRILAGGMFGAAGFLLLATGAAFSGCASASVRTFLVTVDARARPEAVTGYAYAMPAATGPGSSDPRRAEVADRVRVALSQRGFFEAPNPRQADFVVSFDFGEGARQQHVSTVSQPVILPPDPFGSGLPSSQTGSYPGSPYPGSPGSYPSGTGSQVVMVQSTQVTETSVKYLRIWATENRPAPRAGAPAGGGGEIWSVEARIEDESVDAMTNIPALVDALVEFIGTTTPEARKIRVRLEG